MLNPSSLLLLLVILVIILVIIVALIGLFFLAISAKVVLVVIVAKVISVFIVVALIVMGLRLVISLFENECVRFLGTCMSTRILLLLLRMLILKLQGRVTIV